MGFSISNGSLRTVLSLLACVACTAPQPAPTTSEPAAGSPIAAPAAGAIQPVTVTERVAGDSDDPALWIHPEDPTLSIILGTDKGGFLYAFDLEGRIRTDLGTPKLARPNNVDIQQDARIGAESMDIAVVAERYTGSLRIFSLPDLKPIDGGGIEVFVGDPPEYRAPMGTAVYRRPTDGATFAIVSRKYGPEEGYLWQYRLEPGENRTVIGSVVRKFGAFSGDGEIEAIAVDDELGFVYYSDEAAGIFKYAADPDAPETEKELAVFGRDGFAEDREGISIYQTSESTGYILVSDQQANAFRVFRREGGPAGPHDHQLVAVLPVSTNDSDGSDVTSTPLGDKFPQGLFVAMSDDGTFQLYDWRDLAARLPPG